MRHMIRTTSLIACLLALPLALPAGALAQDNNDAPAPGVETYTPAEKGADLTRIWCNACHVTGTGDAESGMDSAPAFVNLTPLVRANPDHYRTFLTKPHGPMREITLSRDEIEAVIAYISSLTPDQP